jgi:hypothetical protein
MPIDYYGRLPRLLRDEFLEGRWLPVVGAGMSANAEAGSGRKPPMWKKLGEEVANYLSTGYGIDGPIDAISTFEQQHGRLALVDKLRDLLLIGEARPGAVHRAFARIPFDTVLTSNIDFLLEDAWNAYHWPFEPVIGEQRLASRRRRLSTLLVKFHGDIHHPNELVVTEEDYDHFLLRYPLLATFVASLLITRVPVLIGYSAEDADFRALLALLKDRLGRNQSTPWVLLAKATPAQVARFERRGVRAVVLDKRPNASHSAVLEQLFSQLAEVLPRAAGTQAEATEDRVLAELRVAGPPSSLVVFLGGNEWLSQYRDLLFPTLRAAGLNPVTIDDVQSAPGLQLASLTQLITRAAVVVIDIRDSRRAFEFGLVVSTVDLSRVVVVGSLDGLADSPSIDMRLIPADRSTDIDYIIPELGQIVIGMIGRDEESRFSMIEQRLMSGDISVAFLEAVIAVESRLRATSDTTRSTFRQLLHEHPLLEPEDIEVLQEVYRLRGDYLHQGNEPLPARAKELTLRLLAILRKLG